MRNDKKSLVNIGVNENSEWTEEKFSQLLHNMMNMGNIINAVAKSIKSSQQN